MSKLESVSTSSDDFKSLQRIFTHYIRTGEEDNAPRGLETRRMVIYRDLFYKNIFKFCSIMYPVLKSVVTEPVFMQMVRQFMKDHRAHTPFFYKIGEEFYAWLEVQSQFDLPPFGLELAHYEWLELAVDVMDVENDACDPNGDCWFGIPLLSATLMCPSYHFAVHKIKTGYTDIEMLKKPTFLSVWRNRHDDVKFMEMNAVTWTLLIHLQHHQNIDQPQLSGLMAAEYVWTRIGSGLGVHRDVFMNGAKETLEKLKAEGIILGTKLSVVV